jgi:predicted dehydrogenase
MIRLALIGCGQVVEVFHLPALLKVREFELAAVVDVDEGRGRRIAARAGAPKARVSRDVQHVVDRCDAALVSVPNMLHADVSVPLLERGRHVLIEKPMAVSVHDCDRLIGAAKGSGAVLSAAMVRRFIPAYDLLATLISSGTFGSPVSALVREGVVYNWGAVTGFFLKREQSGGGVLVDFGPHVLDALLWWFGDLSVDSYEDDSYGGVEAECRVRLRSAAGVAVTIELSRLRQLPCTARVEFERGVVEINLRTGAADVTIGGTRTPIRGRVGVDRRGTWSTPADPFVLQLQRFARDIDTRAGVTASALAGREVAALFEACAGRRRPLQGPAAPVTELDAAQAASAGMVERI